MKVIIVDDNKFMLLIFKKMISKIPGVRIAGVFQSAIEATKFLNFNKIDMAFVDIIMPDLSGIDFAKEAGLEKRDIRLVFLTASKEYALEAFNVHAFDYIVKPVSQERLEETINRARRLFPIATVHSTTPFGAVGK